jgi:hypothetical protein
MRVTEAAAMLSDIARGGSVELPAAELLSALLEGGFVHEAPDREAERARMAELQAALRAATGDEERRRLRGEVLALSEQLAMAEGGARVTMMDGSSPYRDGGGARERRIALGLRGRRLLSDLEPRAARAEALSVEEFEAEMELLRTTIEARGERAAGLAKRLVTISRVPREAAWRSAALGLSACREDDDTIVRVALAVHEALTPRGAPWTPEQVVSATECVCLVAPSLRDVDPDSWCSALLDERDRLLPSVTGSEQALDAAVVLAAMPVAVRAAQLEAAQALVEETARLGQAVPLPSALLCVATGVAARAGFARELVERRLAGGDVDARQGIEALAIGMATGADAGAVAERILAHRTHIARFAKNASLTGAALLAWLDAPLAETLDDLRLAAAVVQTHRLGIDAGETSANAVKLLLLTALLAEGDEGDAEEKLGFGARLHERLRGVGTSTVAATVPLLVGATSAFVQPMLDAASIWDAYRRTTQGYTHYHSHHYYG